MALDWQRIHNTWQQEWKEDRLFHVDVEDYSQKKYYLTTPYPYMSGLLHLGHLFTYMAPEAIARFKRMQGHNVLFKFAFHCTGTPIVAAAQRVKEAEPTQIATLKKMGIADSEIAKFANPEYWCDYFPKENFKDLQKMGFALDERYTFKTTYLDPAYDKFVTWQFNKLHALGYVTKGKHPVMWCPKDNVPVGDHDRAEGEGETPKDFIWIKFRMKDSDLILMTGTTRPDALLGQTNLWVDPHGAYCVAQVHDEKWVVGEAVLGKIREQCDPAATILRKITAQELIGKWVQGPVAQYEIYTLPATFIDAKVGSGLVYSALEDPVDLFELRKIQSDPALLAQFHLNNEVVKKLKPIFIIDVEGMGEDLGDSIGKEFGITSAQQKEKLEEAKGELNRRVYRKGVMKKSCGKYSGMDVPKCQEAIKKELISTSDAVMFWEPTGKVVCRCLTPCIVKVVSNQWFLNYDNEHWKKITHECLDGLTLYPEKVRKQFDYVLDWLQHWACTREFGLGTKLPWDHEWVIESLSDSTMQMAYCTIAKYLEHSKEYGFNVDHLNDAFFEYIFFGKGNVAEIEGKTKVPRAMIEKMRTDFEYWYPFDFRNSAKDLLQNHLAFCLFNHTALFPKKHWPKAYVLNGRIMVNNEKMSKSKGNFFTIRELYEKHTADIIRLTAANAGEGVEDANYDMTFLETAKNKLNEIYDFAFEHYNKGRNDVLIIDTWFENTIHDCVDHATQNMENMLFKSAVQAGLMDMQRALKWYTRRTGGKYNKKVINHFIETQLKLLTPFTPHFCEESWHAIGKKTYISTELWPMAKALDAKAMRGEELIEQTLGDIGEVLKLAKTTQAKSITLLVSEEWKYAAFVEIGRLLEHTREFKEIMGSMMTVEKFKKNSAELTKLIPKFVKVGSVSAVTSQDFELRCLQDAAAFFETEFNCTVLVMRGEESTHAKAKAAAPGKVGIVVE
ncbi:leucine--tRNA ligase [Candidatus Woesearchaeota archaeon]|nr:leucine--tRNA ligase [Candidatus Woesearchaeota archaeon]